LSVVVAHLSFPVASVPQEKVPNESAFTSQFAAFSAETIRFVVDASDAVRLVVDAYGATSDEPENVRNALEVSCPPVVANGMRPERSEEMKVSVDDAVVNDPKPAETAVELANGVVTACPTAAVTSAEPLKYTELFVVVNDAAPVPPLLMPSVPVQPGVRVKVPPELVTESVTLVSVDVAKVSAPV
jgi:hypothetical protein